MAEYGIRGLFDNVDRQPLLRVLRPHCGDCSPKQTIQGFSTLFAMENELCSNLVYGEVEEGGVPC